MDLNAVRLHQFEGFYYVATHEGFTRAAEAMPYPITEPALHQQVRKLERALGIKLLVRAPGRRMVLTPEARGLYEFVAPFYRRRPSFLRELTLGASGTRVVAAEALYVDTLCAEPLTTLQQKRPGIELSLLELDVPQMAEGLLRGDIDVGIVSDATSLAEGLVFEQLGSLGLQLLVPAGHPLGKKRPPLKPKHLGEYSYVVYQRGSEGRIYAEQALAGAGITLRAAAEATSASGMRALVRAGLAPAFVPALGKRPKRKAYPDGTVAFDPTEMLEELKGLPGFGFMRRAGAPGGLVQTFLEVVREQVAR